jgi:GGDEF domain-containing protein
VQTPFTIHGHEANLAVSIGIAIAPQHGTRSDDLINNADLALYRAKANKGSGLNHCIFDPELDEPLDARRSPAGMREASA